MLKKTRIVFLQPNIKKENAKLPTLKKEKIVNFRFLNNIQSLNKCGIFEITKCIFPSLSFTSGALQFKMSLNLFLTCVNNFNENKLLNRNAPPEASSNLN